ncbi:unnamed protein product [Ectocarpus sp. 12 AP-2014]
MCPPVCMQQPVCATCFLLQGLLPSFSLRLTTTVNGSATPHFTRRDTTVLINIRRQVYLKRRVGRSLCVTLLSPSEIGVFPCTPFPPSYGLSGHVSMHNFLVASPFASSAPLSSPLLAPLTVSVSNSPRPTPSNLSPKPFSNLPPLN